MRRFTADYIIPITSNPIKNGIITVDDNGVIVDISSEASLLGDIAYYPGVIIPGFVNTHCHLELSHMKGLVAEGTGLISFIKEVVTKRGFSPEVIQNAIELGDREMYNNGIVAVGDISNTTDTFHVKEHSSLRYHTFVEYFDLMNPAMTQEIIQKYDQVYHAAPNNHFHKATPVPHAPYSVTSALFDHLKTIDTKNHTISIHNQETPPENTLFESKSGEFVTFYNALGNDLESFQAINQSSIHYLMQHLPKSASVMLVHNTLSSSDDIQAAQQYFKNVYWCTCPNANIYIEQRLPDYNLFLENNAIVTVGTDSLTSNHQLSILEEIKTIHRNFPHIPLHTLLLWSTFNGAMALGFADTLGSIEVNKKPGLLVLNVNWDDPKNFLNADVVRIV